MQDTFVRKEFPGWTGEGDLPGFEDVGAVGVLHGEFGVLLDKQNSSAFSIQVADY